MYHVHGLRSVRITPARTQANGGMSASDEDYGAVGVIVAHPDDETLWAGGAILMNPQWRCRVYTLCRASDPDRAPRFHQALERFRARGRMADLDDGPQQAPLEEAAVRRTILTLIGESSFDLLITHGPQGEYTRHRRHAEVSKAVIGLWQEAKIHADRLWLFAYQDGGHAYLPRATEDASIKLPLPPAVWDEKYRIIREVYGFAPDSWEAQAAPRTEAFWCFESPQALATWRHRKEQQG
jgi:LmbE family N-acetylglucosaminyl deacetylase